MTKNDRELLTGEDKFEQAIQRLNIGIRWNVRSGMIECCSDTTKTGVAAWSGWFPWQERISLLIRDRMRATFLSINPKGQQVPYRISKDAFLDERDLYAARHPVDPFKEWLDSLPPKDPKPNKALACDWYLRKMFGAPNNGLMAWAARLIPLSAVWRTYEPGTKIDTMTVLLGDQGLGKDSCIREMLPNSDMFTDQLNFGENDGRKLEAMMGKVFVCASELGGVTNARDIESLKRFITQTHDRWRLAYRRDPEEIPRTCVFTGSTNKNTPLPNDPSGNRRWIVVPLKHGCDVEAFMAKHREKIWIDAIDLYKKGVKPTLPRELLEDQKADNERYRASDFQIEEPLDTIIQLGELNTPLQSAEIAVMVGLCETPLSFTRVEKSAQYRLRDALEGRGFIRKAVRNSVGVRRVWVKHEGD